MSESKKALKKKVLKPIFISLEEFTIDPPGSRKPATIVWYIAAIDAGIVTIPSEKKIIIKFV